jgi:adenylate cyclase class IV
MESTKKEYKRFTVEIDTTEIEQSGIFVSVQTEDMTQEDIDNSVEYVNTLEDAFAVVEKMIRECF